MRISGDSSSSDSDDDLSRFAAVAVSAEELTQTQKRIAHQVTVCDMQSQGLSQGMLSQGMCVCDRVTSCDQVQITPLMTPLMAAWLMAAGPTKAGQSWECSQALQSRT